MFERFTHSARQLVVQAQVEARALGHDWVGTEHLLLAAADSGSPLAGTMSRLGLGSAALHERLRAALGTPGDGDDALRDLGIDLEEVRRRVEAAFGPGALDSGQPPRARPPRPRRPRLLRRRRRDCAGSTGGGHVPFTAAAKKALESALRESMRLRSGDIRAEHVLLGVLAQGGLATEVVSGLGVRPDEVRRAVIEQLGDAA